MAASPIRKACLLLPGAIPSLAMPRHRQACNCRHSAAPLGSPTGWHAKLTRNGTPSSLGAAR
eukprot:3011342-Pyramimonas_sp.AAC.1